MGLTPSRPLLPAHASPAQLASHLSLPTSSHWLCSSPRLTSLPSPPTNHTHTASLLQQGWAARTHATKHATWARDPFDDDDNDAEAVLQVEYLGGTREGEQFSMRVPDLKARAQTAILSYEVAFDPAFDFVKGGKLPGLYGSTPTAAKGGKKGHGLCAGGKHLATCLSARLMWRPDGLGEVYAYVPTYEGFCDEREGVECDRAFGTSLGRGSWRFERGGWTTITQLVALNSAPNAANGLLALYVNHSLVYSHDHVLWRTDPTLTLSSVLFSTFFGGGDESYDAPAGGTRSYFRRFETYHSESPSPLPPSRTVTPVWGDPSPLSRARRRRADALSRALVACLCVALLCAPVLQWWTA
ncbi:hypothetical protein DMC30DRAFT_381187 [Rhodotorula diobovata]|uniref:Polysaccharide lyase 14 domain-containing protein n=1 Tax=Rhodotorula diobovata TaxID=5288 RepID=A0A5C5FNX1_9BASI|nr:hypothetical protein DMC30DRAFT_381187 [Rhodotorula diobovata]